jgi:hypothetical protein
LEHIFNRALKEQDYAALEGLYAGDYMLVRPDGSVLNKQEVLQDLRSGGLRFHSIELGQTRQTPACRHSKIGGEFRSVHALLIGAFHITIFNVSDVVSGAGCGFGPSPTKFVAEHGTTTL